MASEDDKPDSGRRFAAEARRARAERDRGYRRRALQLLPWVCAKCGREFSGENLHRLTVHHKDHDHRNNPPDGSNWELLCLYCHDDEHSRKDVADAYAPARPRRRREPSTYRPFADLDELLKKE